MRNLIAVLVVLCALGLNAASVAAQVVLRPEVRKVMVEAQTALKAEQYEQALGLTNNALAIPELTLAERTTILQTRAFASLRAKSWDGGIDALEQLVDIAGLSLPERLQTIESLIFASQQTKDYARLVKWSGQYLSYGGQNDSVRTAMIQSMYLLEDYAGVVRETREKIRLDAVAKRPVDEQNLRLLAVSQRKLKNDDGYLEVLKQLVAYFPTKDYRIELVARLQRQPYFNARYELDYYRYLNKTDSLEDARGYTQLATLALNAGLPFEALAILNKGYDAGVLGLGAEKTAHAQLKATAQKKTLEDDAQFAQQLKSARDGNAWANVAEVYFSKHNWAEANKAFAQALSQGNIRREQELHLHYGISLLEAGQGSEALAQFQSINADLTALDIVNLWKPLIFS